MPDRQTPVSLTGERETLQEFLDYLRESVILKVHDLDEASARRAMVPSGTSLLGLLKHLTTAEVAWFQYGFAGLDVQIPPGHVEPTDSVASVVDSYRATVAMNAQIMNGCPDIERLSERVLTTREPMSLRWILVHMVEETARHAGHADILLEQLDGTTGR
jgi:uncharacterized damage-inducible protein DinB